MGTARVANYPLKFTPQLHQRHVIEALRLFSVVWMCGGLGAGKTWLLVWYAILMSQVMAPGIDGLIVEPDYDTFRDVFAVLWRDNYPGEGSLWELRNSQKHGRHLWVRGNGGAADTRIFYRSAHNEQYVRKIDSLTTIGWAGLDEPSRMQCGKRAFELAQGRTRSKKMERLGWKHNPILIVGVPDGFNWLASGVFGLTEDHPQHAYETGYVVQPAPQTEPDVKYYIRACYTKDNADNLAEHYERNARLVWNETFANQMFAAALVSSQGMILPEFSKPLHVIPNDLADRLWRDKVVRPIGGMDWGFTAPAATVIMGWTGDHELIVIDEWYERGRQVQEQGAWAWQANQRWGKRHDAQGRLTIPYFGDPADPGKIEMLSKGFEWAGQHMALDVSAAKYHGSSEQHTSAPTGWQARIDLMRALLTPRRNVQHPNFTAAANPGAPRLLIAERCTNLPVEIAGYRQKEQQEGRPEREGATGPDHSIDCVAGAAYTTDTTIEPAGYGGSGKRGHNAVSGRSQGRGHRAA